MASQYDFETTEERLEALESFGLPKAAIERFLHSRNLRVPKKDENFELKVAEQVTGEMFKDLIIQHKYAGSLTVNYFIITGISEFDLEEIEEDVFGRLPRRNDVEGVADEPFIADSEHIGARLYLTIGFFQYAGGENVNTGKRTSTLVTRRSVVVIHEDADLVEIRGSNLTTMVDVIRDQICRSIGKYRDSVKSRPKFGVEFQDEFNELVERYYNLKVRVEDDADSTLDTISFTSKEDEKGNRKDAREDSRVVEELEERGGEITMGYVELDEGFRFRINRRDSKISFTRNEREENLHQVYELIDNVLRETDEYSQGTISGTEDVPS